MTKKTTVKSTAYSFVIPFMLIVLTLSAMKLTEVLAYEGYSEPIDDFYIDKDVVSIKDTAIFRIGFYSINGSSWTAFNFSGESLDYSNYDWIKSEAAASLPDFGEGTHYVAAYSCARTTQWDCHENRWQILTINNSGGCNLGTQTDCGHCGDTCKTGERCILGVCSLSGAKEYYLSPAGNDVTGDGTIEKPWFTLSKAWENVHAGDIIYLRGGVYAYSSKQNLKGKSGKKDDMIYVWAYPNEHPKITVSKNFDYGHWPQGIISFTGDYVHWKGIELYGASQKSDGSGGFGFVSQDSNHNIFEQLDIHHNMNGFHLRGDSTDNLLLNIDSHHNQDPYSEDRYGNADGISLGYTPQGTSNTIKGCRVWWNSDDGFDFWSNDGDILVEDCWAFYNGYVPDTFNSAGDGCGYKYGITDEDHAEVLITTKDSIAYMNKNAGYHQNGAKARLEFSNNVAYENGMQGYWFASFDKAHIFSKNIDYKNVEHPELTNESSLTDNTFLLSGESNPSLNVSDNDFVSLSDDDLISGRDHDGSLPKSTFLKTRSDSDLVALGYR